MVLAGIGKLVLGSIAFGIFWVMAVFPAVPFLPIGRTAGSLLGALLMIIFQVISPAQAYAAVDLPILCLLFGTMVVSIYLEKAHMFRYLGRLLSWRSAGSRDLLCRICLISALASALFTNDTCCIVLTEFVLKFAKQRELPPLPFLLALASSANIGSSATPIGNPQNLVIAVQSHISFGRFLLGVLPAMLVGVCINTAIILCMFWRSLSAPDKKPLPPPTPQALEIEVLSHKFSPARMSHQSTPEVDDVGEGSHRFSPAMMSHPVPAASSSHEVAPDGDVEKGGAPASRHLSPLPDAKNEGEEGEDAERRRSRRALFLKGSVYVVTAGMLVALLMGLNMSWTAITAAIALVVIDFKDAGPCLEKVSYSLLIFFCGMFITVDGFNKTGIPTAFWNLMEPSARIDRASGVAVLSVVILLLSNFASNVPTVLLLGAQVARSAAAISPADVNKAWLILAWVSTVAGNLSLLGSAANLIVCEQARRSELHGYDLTFWKHLQFGLPSTIIVTAVGLPLIRG
ncbi:hypothetical protein AXF42_Ash016953 [Apostasia shenzhenica]|uniref:Citrate transporter-like domain-containing protein n=1 Tax=Apostasia shenzhenica TaxID=1088818 RepID=A0A2H9ZRK6_9ASPA|nr:hypothetical protein AXF42_Ash016953 [Apostasia shenzhenica]